MDKELSELTRLSQDLDREIVQKQLAEELMKYHGVNDEEPGRIFVACHDKEISNNDFEHIEFEIKLNNDGRNFKVSCFNSVLENGIEEDKKLDLEKKARDVFADKIKVMLEEIHSKEKTLDSVDTKVEEKGIRNKLKKIREEKFKSVQKNSSKTKAKENER